MKKNIKSLVMRNYPVAALSFPCVLALVLSSCAHTSRLAVKDSIEPVEVRGLADFNQKDLAASRNAALADAFKNAVIEAASLFAQDPAEIAAMSVNPHPYMRKYQLLSEAREGASYRVVVKAYMELSKIAADLRGRVPPGASRTGTRAALAVTETGPGAGDNFAAAFKKNLGGGSVVFENYPWLKDVSAGGKTPEELIVSARDSGADLLFYVQAQARPAGAGLATGFYPINSEAKLSVYDASSGQQLFQASTQANALDASESASGAKSLYSTGELMAQNAALNLDRMVKKSPELILRVRKLGGFANLKILKGEADKLGAKSLQLESYSDEEAVFIIAPANPDAQELASALLRQDTLGLDLESATPAEVVFSANR